MSHPGAEPLLIITADGSLASAARQMTQAGSPILLVIGRERALAISVHVDSLDRVRAWLEQREAHRSEQKRRQEQYGSPPDLGRVWVDTTTVAVMAGLTVNWVTWQIGEERMPTVFHGGQ